MHRQFFLLPLTVTIALSPSCTVVHGDANKGTYTLASVGGDIKGYAQSARGVTAESMDNSTSFREINKTARFGIGAAAAQSIVGDIAGAYRAVKAGQEATKAVGIKSAASVEEAKIAADVSKTQLANEAAAAAATPAP